MDDASDDAPNEEAQDDDARDHALNAGAPNDVAQDDAPDEDTPDDVAQDDAPDAGASGPPDALAGPDDVRERLAGGRLLAATDFDGTLAEIVEQPGDAAIRDDARDSLLRLADAPGTDVAVVSGRALEDLRQQVALDRSAATAGDGETVAYAGNHGLEIVAGDRRRVHPAAQAAREELDAALEAVAAVADDVEGTRAEDKRLSATVHYRQVEGPAAVARIEDVVRDAAASRDALEVHGAKQALELRPAVDWGKGRAVEWLLDELADGDATALYVGDDETDEDAFRAIGDDGVTIRVGDAETAAQWRLSDPAAVAEFFDWLADVRQTVGE